MPSRKVIASGCLATLGVAVLSYLAGAAVTFFQLPTSELLGRAFIGASAWRDKHAPVLPPAAADVKSANRPALDYPDATCDGFTLYARLGSTEATLVDMQLEIVHRWAIPFSRVWPQPPHLNARLPDSHFCFMACHVYDNGDLLAVFHGKHSPIGCGLVKLDKDSNILWSFAGPTHHDVDVADDGTIYAIEQKFVYDLPKELERIATPCEVDDLIVLSPEGRPLREGVSIVSAFLDTPYVELLESVKWPVERHTPPPGSTAPHVEYEMMVGDPLHTNSIKVLSRDLAPNFPMFKEGQVLISIRNLAVLAIVDLELGKVVWATRGPWYAQHDAQFLTNGHLLLYDNLGVAGGSRVIEYDPQTQALPWSCAGPAEAPFYSSERGGCQRLANGNTLIVNSEPGEIIEVTADKRIVWSMPVDHYVTTAKRYGAEKLSFLGGQDPRP